MLTGRKGGRRSKKRRQRDASGRLVATPSNSAPGPVFEPPSFRDSSLPQQMDISVSDQDDNGDISEPSVSDRKDGKSAKPAGLQQQQSAIVKRKRKRAVTITAGAAPAASSSATAPATGGAARDPFEFSSASFPPLPRGRRKAVQSEQLCFM
jgi:hypothetical protein